MCHLEYRTEALSGQVARLRERGLLFKRGVISSPGLTRRVDHALAVLDDASAVGRSAQIPGHQSWRGRSGLATPPGRDEYVADRKEDTR
jgi:hypothetical protein